MLTESAMLPDRTGAGLREVDVLITSHARDGRQVRIGVECRDHIQKPDITWVEQVVTKQADLELAAVSPWARSPKPVTTALSW
ncbi:hypothetical protein E1286_27675 [Nonomuraea terrae]|uniref:Uncharacterized protein n=1 Tax=Nonomuraea terrae TaxID=2530383 RepID=A0A4R4YHD8_9ACTN|nr:hypothetical protein [Nonomuraea terrae]TDD44156.1 hypothetical protein E1286_27675 [Nonomuraea terrae]